jgi:hypothetical protein
VLVNICQINNNVLPNTIRFPKVNNIELAANSEVAISIASVKNQRSLKASSSFKILITTSENCIISKNYYNYFFSNLQVSLTKNFTIKPNLLTTGTLTSYEISFSYSGVLINGDILYLTVPAQILLINPLTILNQNNTTLNYKVIPSRNFYTLRIVFFPTTVNVTIQQMS